MVPAAQQNPKETLDTKRYMGGNTAILVFAEVTAQMQGVVSSMVDQRCFRRVAFNAPHFFTKLHNCAIPSRNSATLQAWRKLEASLVIWQRDAVRLSRHFLRRDRRLQLDEVAADADRACLFGDNRQLFKLAKSLSGFKPSAVKAIKMKNGEISTSTEEFELRWLEHFRGIFDAETLGSIDDLDVREPADNFQPALPPPSVERTERALSRLAKGKALGSDEISAELIAVGGSAFASKYHEILQRMWSKAYYPRRWRGGRLAELLKKGSALECDNYRGLLISDHMGKAAAEIIDDFLEPDYMDYIPKEQCGGAKGRGTGMANHMVRLYMDYAAAWSAPLCIIFLDLVKAFDLALREIVLGWQQMFKADKIDFLVSLGLERGRC